ncbi:Hydrolase/ protein serine/threonine phosphatase [Zea mays]|uniref:Hydrolase/ protein serine/threonine phosphatase n=1 Tax=Zea mays TaxID=4577 RepID=A0A1D6EWM8_MAIZE|nr:Hydrolase/ protein serine/threonine phosphatase [Zea mays]
MPPKRGAAGTRCTTSAAHGATEFATGSRSVAGQSAAQFVVEAATQLAAQATTPTIALVLRYASKDKMDLAPQGLITQQQKANERRPVGSSQIWTRYGVLLPSQQTRKLKEWILTDEQQQLVNASGLGHLALTTGFTIDRSLLTSFCERWNNETNTAHFMGFEIAPSLRDVSYILGIPVTGHVVTAEPIGDEAVKRMCLHYLGESPGNGEQLCGLIRLTWLYRNFHQLPEHPTINKIAYSTRAYLLYLVGSTLFPDTMRGFVSPRYLPLLADFGKIREYAWGAAALAHLYRGLSVAVTPNATTQFLGSATLLMVNWNPYKDMNPAIVPEYCIAADNICYSRTWLISFNIKEAYVPDRFARQFGREQGRLHGVPMWTRRTWSKWKDWRTEYAREIEEFHQLVGCHFTPPAETNINSFPLHESSAGQNDAGCSLNISHNFSAMVEDLKNDLPVIGRYLEGNLLPSDVASFLERVSTMIKSYTPPQGSRRKDRVSHGPADPVRSKNPRKRGRHSLFQDSFPHRYLGTPVNIVFDGTIPLLNGGEALKEQVAMDPWRVSQSHLTMTTSSSSLDSSSPESMKRRREGGDEIPITRDTDCLQSGRLCVQLKMFKHRDGVNAEAANPIFR